MMRMTRKSDDYARDMEMSEAGFNDVRSLFICDISELQARERHQKAYRTTSISSVQRTNA